MSVIEFVRRSAVNYVSVKIALSILGLAVSIPVISLLYWSFDSAYLAAFGVGPEIFSRPVFSSKLMLTWFVLGAINPGIGILGAIALALFVVLLGTQYKARKAKAREVTCNQPGQSENEQVRVIDIIDRSFTPAMYLFLLPLFILIFLLLAMIFMANKAEKLASDQINAYVEKGNCPDTFNNQTNGCYSISDEPDNNYFIIANNEKLVIYLSRQETEKEVLVYATVKDKLSNKKVIRGFKRVQRLSDEPEKKEAS